MIKVITGTTDTISKILLVLRRYPWRYIYIGKIVVTYSCRPAHSFGIKGTLFLFPYPSVQSFMIMCSVVQEWKRNAKHKTQNNQPKKLVLTFIILVKLHKQGFGSSILLHILLCISHSMYTSHTLYPFTHSPTHTRTFEYVRNNKTC